MPSTFRTNAVAIGLARRGWPVLPCHHPVVDGCSCGDADCASPAKHPRTRHGLHVATTDLATVRRWWRAWPEANVAVRTGSHPKGAGVVVVDVDPAHGGAASLDTLTGAHGPLPPTLEATTGGGGRHLYFRHPGGAVPNSAGRLGPGLDVRGDGGYVLVPPSRHRSGGRYRWQPAPVADLPAWLHRLITTEPVPVVGRSAVVRTPRAWAAAALADETARVRRAAEGSRNDTLNRAAYALGQLVSAGHLHHDDVAAQLAAAAVAAGLSAREVHATIVSGLRAGASAPRHPTAR